MGRQTGKPVRMADLAGAPPRMATSDDLQAAGAVKAGRAHPARVSSKLPGRINLKAVAEACIEEGLDPAVAIVQALNAKVPVLDRSGQPVLGEDGKPMMVDRVDPDTRLRTLNELLQYTQPKLKAVEVKMSGNLDLSADQLDQRLAALLAKAVK